MKTSPLWKTESWKNWNKFYQKKKKKKVRCLSGFFQLLNYFAPFLCCFQEYYSKYAKATSYSKKSHHFKKKFLECREFLWLKIKSKIMNGNLIICLSSFRRKKSWVFTLTHLPIVLFQITTNNSSREDLFFFSKYPVTTRERFLYYTFYLILAQSLKTPNQKCNIKWKGDHKWSC